jgi:Gram-negative bacterial TonB protein C-terminal
MSQGSATLISVAKDGHFGAVIVGTSLQDRFPEIQGVWGQRVIYTVYLHVGLSHSWILQYSLSPALDAASAGNTGRLEAPWPYTIVRPELAWEETGAVIVSGLVDQSGKFQNLKIIVPSPFSLSDFVLQCLRQWQFRPAAQSGHAIPVEVMLIIPDS